MSTRQPAAREPTHHWRARSDRAIDSGRPRYRCGVRRHRPRNARAHAGYRGRHWEANAGRERRRLTRRRRTSAEGPPPHRHRARRNHSDRGHHPRARDSRRTNPTVGARREDPHADGGGPDQEPDWRRDGPRREDGEEPLEHPQLAAPTSATCVCWGQPASAGVGNLRLLVSLAARAADWAPATGGPAVSASAGYRRRVGFGRARGAGASDRVARSRQPRSGLAAAGESAPGGRASGGASSGAPWGGDPRATGRGAPAGLAGRGGWRRYNASSAAVGCSSLVLRSNKCRRRRRRNRRIHRMWPGTAAAHTEKACRSACS
jgi:hypothetical protein